MKFSEARRLKTSVTTYAKCSSMYLPHSWNTKTIFAFTVKVRSASKHQRKYLLVSFLQYIVIGTHLKPWNQEEQKKMSREKKRKCFFFLSLNLTSTVLLFWNKNKHLRPYLLRVNERFASSCSSKKSAIFKVESCSYHFFPFLNTWQNFLSSFQEAEKNWVKKVNIFSGTRLYRKNW